MNNWSLKPRSRKCSISGNTFIAGERFVSIIYIDSKGLIQRIDISEKAQLPPEIETSSIVAKWSRVLKEEIQEDNENKKTFLVHAEELFLSLFQEDSNSTELKEREILKQILGLLLERKRILKRLRELDDSTLVYLHNPSKQEYTVSVKNASIEDIKKAQEQLNSIL